jgi:hypothetical protein
MKLKRLTAKRHLRKVVHSKMPKGHLILNHLLPLQSKVL